MYFETSNLQTWFPKISTFVEHCNKFVKFHKLGIKTFFSKNFAPLQYCCSL